ncbi:MAG: YaiO family outer membrane beta-barrel protein [Burkholderiales bacterium]|nr:YaiO family outer membrane beta-barrel protein [Burkholderiales bacterium]
MTVRAALIVALLLPAAAFAEPTAVEVELSASREQVTGGRGDWRSAALEAVRRLGPRESLYGGVRRTERFRLQDAELFGGYAWPIGPGWNALLEASASGSHRVLPKHSIYGQLGRELEGGWVLSAGLRHSSFTLTDVRVLVLGAERYFADWRAGLTIFAGRPQGASTGVSARLALAHSYSDGSSVGVAAVVGRQVENAGPPVGVIANRVYGLSIGGRHWVNQNWALSWELATHEQGDLYRRRGLHLGLRHRF